MEKYNLIWKASTFLLLTFHLTGCRQQKMLPESGHIIHSLKFYEPVYKDYIKQPIYWPDTKIWYKDSIIIQEITGLYISRDTKGQEVREIKSEFYIFIDLPSRSFYKYSTFTDTSKIVKKYTQPDSLKIEGGWNFYAPFELPKASPPQILADTIIDGVNYKRLSLFYYYKNRIDSIPRIVESMGYFRCDKSGTMFKLDITYSKKMGCPLVRLDYHLSEDEKIRSSSQVEFVRNTLTSEELKVFNAWEKNAKNNPVSKN